MDKYRIKWDRPDEDDSDALWYLGTAELPPSDDDSFDDDVDTVFGEG